MDKYLENLQSAIKDIKIADHILYVTFPVIKDKRLLMKALDQIYRSVISAINSILQYDFLFKRVSLSKNPKENWSVFTGKSAPRFNISREELSIISELISIIESHKKSPMEFQRKEKIVIMSDSLKTTIVDSDSLKTFLRTAKNLVNKAQFGMNLSK